ncbi:MAG: peptidylprolyl isomerase [Calditrichaceae bacterium]
MLKRLMSIVMVGIFALLAASCSLSDDTVAKVGNYAISKVEFEEQLKRKFPEKESYIDVPKEEKMKILDQMLMQKLKLTDAYDSKLQEDGAIITNFESHKENLYAKKYFEKIVVDKLVTEEELRASFDLQKDRINVSHILISYKGISRSPATRTMDEAIALSKEIVEKARAGEDFAELAQKYSDDRTVGKNKGSLGFLTPGKMVPEFEKAAYKLNAGEISDPVLTIYGYHIIKLDDKKPNDAFKFAQYDREKENLKKIFFQAYRDTARIMWDAHIAAVKKKTSFRIADGNIETLVNSSIEKSGKSGGLKIEDYTDQEKTMVLAEWSGKTLTLNDLFQAYSSTIMRMKSTLMSVEGLRGVTENYAVRKMLLADAIKIGVNKDPDVVGILNQMLEQPMITAIEKKQVMDKVKIEDEDLLKYYEENKNEFILPEELEIWELFLKDEAKAKKVSKLAKSGQNFEKLVEKYSEDPGIKKKNGYLGFRTINSRENVATTAFKLGPNKISDPFRFRNGWVVIKTGKLNPETIRSFESAKQLVTSKVRGLKIRERRAQWENELKEKYSVKINQDLLEKI